MNVDEYSESDGVSIQIKLVASELGFGGGERIFLDLALAFTELGFNVVTSTIENSKLFEALKKEELLPYQKKKRYLKSEKSVLIANDFSSLLKHVLPLKMKKAFICHGPWELTWKKKLFLKLFGIQVFCVSKYVGAYAFRGICLNRSKVNVLMYGPNLDQVEFSYSKRVIARKKFGINTNDFVIGSLSRYHSVKRIDKIIDMFKGKKEILILGLSTGFNTEDEKQTEKLIDRMHLQQNVKVFKNVQPSDFFDAVDVLISFSKSETLGLTLLEASARGIPSFTTAIGGVNDYLIHGLNSYFLGHSDLGLIESEFFSKIQDKFLLERLSNNCKKISLNRNPKIAASQIIEKLK